MYHWLFLSTKAQDRLSQNEMCIREPLGLCRDVSRQWEDQNVDDDREFWKIVAAEPPGNSQIEVLYALDVV